MSTTQVKLTDIRRDFSLQIRCENDGHQIENIREAIRDKAQLPPIDLFSVGGTHYFIGDGWHRFLASEAEGLKHIEATVHVGGRKEALKFALGANATHGLRRTNKDKRKALEVAHREFPKSSARALADLCKVSPQTAATFLSEVSNLDTSRVGKDGKSYPPKSLKQVDFWEVWSQDANEVLTGVEGLLNNEAWLTSAGEDPARAAGELEAFAETMRLKAKEAEEKAAAIRKGAAQSK